jgi:esterase/lipase
MVGTGSVDEAGGVLDNACTYIDEIHCPLLVIQGRNDPRVIERE